MDNETKLEKHYNSEKLRKAIMLMEQFYCLSQDVKLDEKNRKAAYGMFEHERRLALCILMKPFESGFKVEQIIDCDYMKKMYDKYAE